MTHPFNQKATCVLCGNNIEKGQLAGEIQAYVRRGTYSDSDGTKLVLFHSDCMRKWEFLEKFVEALDRYPSVIEHDRWGFAKVSQDDEVTIDWYEIRGFDDH